ncbi:hypothetical protein [Propioniciclava tarda]|uniref:Uncharacterized protein n=1 Tax=Propioniciclava tarda TaxID=433330 RepID=A0A4Q9KKS1_PROTD|nr:hypothetical protein [Propioniciclava tarda]TBT95096.1 hypothetical protein ET996_07495 [Propioniciclava tarda]
MTSTPERIALPALLAGQGLFQAALACGAPWGAAAWGGTEPGRLPTNKRIASGAAAIVYLALAARSITALGHTPSMALAGLMALGTATNAASPSRWERFGWAPYTATIGCLAWRAAHQASASPLPC